MWIAHIALNYFEMTFYVSRATIKPAPRIKRIVINERTHFVAIAHKSFSQM
jgi:hypothetical protein